MRLSMKKEQPASSTILLLDWLGTEQKKTTACVCPKNRGHFTALAAESSVLSVNHYLFQVKSIYSFCILYTI